LTNDIHAFICEQQKMIFHKKIMNSLLAGILDTVTAKFNISQLDASHIIDTYGEFIDDNPASVQDFIDKIQLWLDKDFSCIKEPRMNNIGIFIFTMDYPCIPGDIIHRYLALADEYEHVRKCSICHEDENDIRAKNIEFVKLTCTLETSSCFFCRNCITDWLTKFSGTCPVCRQHPFFHETTKAIYVKGSTLKVYSKNAVVHKYQVTIPGSPPVNIINLPLP
jgi:hypothetical protein